jgi:hypothetical protein
MTGRASCARYGARRLAYDRGCHATGAFMSAIIEIVSDVV